MIQKLNLLLAMGSPTLLTQPKLGIWFCVMAVIPLEKDVIYFLIPSTKIATEF